MTIMYRYVFVKKYTIYPNFLIAVVYRIESEHFKQSAG